jgi:hypothetical protein
LESKTKLRILKEKKEQFSKILESSEGLRNELRDGLGELLGKDVISSSVHPNFHTQHDPTLLIGHIESAWPHDWLDSLPVRVNTEITTWESRGDSADIHSLIGLDKLPDSIRDTAAALVGEIINLSTDDSYNKDGTKTDKGDVKAAKPAYHDIDPRNETKRERWNDTQPFFPLFLEWEARYAHIDYSQWSLDERAFTSQGSAKMGYGMMNDDPLYDRPDWAASKAEQNLRILSGRVLVLPQTSFALQAQVDSVLDQMPAKDLEEAFRDIEITPDQLRQEVSKLAFLSSSMSGFHDHLLTMSQGTHIKPTIKQPGGKLKAMEDAVNPLVGFDHDLAAYLGAETDLTPYAKLVAVLEKIRDNPSKPVTHGQFKIMKLNVVDKFGQVAHALDPRWDAPSRNIRPCLSDFVAP